MLLQPMLQTACAFVAIWAVILVETMTCDTAWGGIFTIVADMVIKTVIAAAVAVGTLILGLLLHLPSVREWWQRIGYRSLLLCVLCLGVMIFATELGLRTEDPVSGYRMMPFRVSVVCLAGIGFPIANLPGRTAPPNFRV
jgi:hypothetical protein